MKKNKFRNIQSAYSLIEILIAVIIVGVIASIALVQYGIIVEKMKAKEGEQTLFAVYGRMKVVTLEKGAQVCPDFADLGVVLRASNNFNAPTSSCAAVLANPISFITYTISLQRTTGAYTLRIDSDSVATLVPDVVCVSAQTGLCSKLGY